MALGIGPMGIAAVNFVCITFFFVFELEFQYIFEANRSISQDKEVLK